MTEHIPHQVGHYIITPFSGLNRCGDYAASVSVRRGQHDRVFRLVPVFRSAAQATRYALRQGKRLIALNQLG